MLLVLRVDSWAGKEEWLTWLPVMPIITISLVISWEYPMMSSCLISRGVEVKEVIEKKEPNKATGLDVTYSLNVGYITYQ